MKKKRVCLISSDYFIGTENISEGLKLKESSYLPILGAKKFRNMDRIGKITFAAMKSALQRSGHVINGEPSAQCTVLWGTMYGALNSIHQFDMTSLEKGELGVNPSEFPNTVLNAPSCVSSIQEGIRGPILSFYGKSASFDAIGMAYEMLRTGLSQVALAGGSDELPFKHFRKYTDLVDVESAAFVVLKNMEDKYLPAIIGYHTFTTVLPVFENNYTIGDIWKKIWSYLVEKNIDLNRVKKVYIDSDFCEEKQLVIQTRMEQGGIKGKYILSVHNLMGAGGAVLVSQMLRECGVRKVTNPAICLFLGVEEYKISLLIVEYGD